MCFVTLWGACNKWNVVEGREVRKDWKALRKKRSRMRRGATGLLEWHGCLWRHHSRRRGVDKGEVGEITGPHPTLCSAVSFPVPVLSEGAMRVFEGIPAGAVWLCVRACVGSQLNVHNFICTDARARCNINACTWAMTAWVNKFRCVCTVHAQFYSCMCLCLHMCACDGRAARYSTSHSECWRGRAGAAGRRRDRQLFPPHISVQRRHQSLAEMSVLQAGDRPLNVSPSQVNTESLPASHRQKGVGWGRWR